MALLILFDLMMLYILFLFVFGLININDALFHFGCYGFRCFNLPPLRKQKKKRAQYTLPVRSIISLEMPLTLFLF